MDDTVLLLPHGGIGREPRCETARRLVAPRVLDEVPDPPPVVATDPAVDLDRFRQWTPEFQQKALDIIRSREANPWRPFYCRRQDCNGKPHDEWSWPHARSDQHPPPLSDDWLVWLMKGGRGGGKTRGGAEYTHRMTKVSPRLALIAPTGNDIRDTMVEGVSGLLATAPPNQMPLWEPSKKRLTWPNGAQAQGFSGEEPDRLRGPQHHFAWIDEPAHIALIEDVWDNLLFGLRLGKAPRICATTTPKSTKWMKQLVKDPLTRISNFSTYANIDNLADTFKRTILDRYEGTRLGKQELYGEILEDVEGALWALAMLMYVEEAPDLDRIVVSIDPAGSTNRKSDDTGIIVEGVSGQNIYVLADRTGKYSPDGWATAAVNAYHEYSADAIVCERNYGGDMVRSVLASNGARDIRILEVTSRRGKAIRAEPIVGLYEKKRVFHVRGAVPSLEEEMLAWVPGQGASPNRVDALVHGATELGRISMPAQVATPTSLQRLDNRAVAYGGR